MRQDCSIFNESYTGDPHQCTDDPGTVDPTPGDTQAPSVSPGPRLSSPPTSMAGVGMGDIAVIAFNSGHSNNAIGKTRICMMVCCLIFSYQDF